MSHVLGSFLPAEHYLLSFRPPKTLPCAETRCDLEARRRVQKRRTKGRPNVCQNSLFSQTPSPVGRRQLNFAFPGYLSWFWVSERSVKNVGALGVEIFWLSPQLVAISHNFATHDCGAERALKFLHRKLYTEGLRYTYLPMSTLIKRSCDVV